MELPPHGESTDHWDRLVKHVKAEKNQTLLGALNTKGLKSKMVEGHFYDWLAEVLVGLISESGFTDFMLLTRVTAKATRKRKNS